MKLLISEVLQKAHNAKTKAEKIKILKENNSQALRSLFIWNYDDSVVSIIPEGEVPYTPNEAPIGTEHTRLELEARKLYYFVKAFHLILLFSLERCKLPRQQETPYY